MIEDSGHTGSPAMGEKWLAAADRMYQQIARA
jgi:hypothetical protein